MNSRINAVYEDILNGQQLVGSEFIYEEHGEYLIAIEFDDDGNEAARYRVGVSLEKL